MSHRLAKIIVTKGWLQFFGERGITTPAHDKTLVPAVGGTAEWPLVSKIIVAASSTVRDGLTHLVMEMQRIAVGGINGVSQKCL